MEHIVTRSGIDKQLNWNTMEHYSGLRLLNTTSLGVPGLSRGGQNWTNRRPTIKGELYAPERDLGAGAIVPLRPALLLLLYLPDITQPLVVRGLVFFWPFFTG